MEGALRAAAARACLAALVRLGLVGRLLRLHLGVEAEGDRLRVAVRRHTSRLGHAGVGRRQAREALAVRAERRRESERSLGPALAAGKVDAAELREACDGRRRTP